MKSYEYKTTFGNLYKAAYYDKMHDYDVGEVLPSDPIVPEGNGWEMCGFAASTHLLYWSWKRPMNVKNKKL